MKRASTICNIFLCSIFFGLPLVLDRGYFNISAAKSLYFLLSSAVFCLIAIVRFVASLLKKKPLPLSLAPLDIAMLAFGAVNVLSAAASGLGADVWLGRDSRLQGALVIVLYVLMYMAISGSLPDLDNKNYPIRFLATGFVLVAGLALLNALNSDPTGLFTNMDTTQRYLFITTIGNINFFSSYACLCLPVFIIMSAYAQNRMSYIYWGIVLVLSGVAAVLSCSEGFVLGFAAFLAAAPFFFFHNSQRFIRFCSSLLTVLLAAAAFYHIHEALPDPIYRPAELVSLFLDGPWIWLMCVSVLAACLLAHYRPGSLRTVRWIYLGLLLAALMALLVLFIHANNNGADKMTRFLVFNDRWGSGRGKVYRLCAEILQDFSLKQWMIGIGPEALQNVMAKRGITYIDQAHSEYLQALITTGLLGLTAQLGIIGLTVAAVLRCAPKEPVAIALLMGLVAYWAQASVSIAQSFTTPIAYAYIGIIGGIYKYSAVDNKPK